MFPLYDEKWTITKQTAEYIPPSDLSALLQNHLQRLQRRCWSVFHIRNEEQRSWLPSLVSVEGHVCPSVEVFYWGLHTITATSASCQRLVWWKVLLLHLSSLSGTFLWSQWSQWLTWHDCYASHHSLLCLMTQTDYKSPIVCLSHGPVRVCIYLCELNFSWKCFCLYYKTAAGHAGKYTTATSAPFCRLYKNPQTCWNKLYTIFWTYNTNHTQKKNLQ